MESLVEYNEIFTYNKNFNLDSAIKQNKVNIISYQESFNREKSGNSLEGLQFKTNKDFDHEISNMFSLEFSIAKNVNNDISRLLVGLEDFKNILNRNSMYHYDYKSLLELKNNYFSRYEKDEKINYTSLINVYRYLDNIMTNLISDMIPNKSKYLGFNFIYESHILERSKYQHKNSDSRISIQDRYDSYNFSKERNLTFRNKDYNKNRILSR